MRPDTLSHRAAAGLTAAAGRDIKELLSLWFYLSELFTFAVNIGTTFFYLSCLKDHIKTLLKRHNATGYSGRILTY